MIKNYGKKKSGEAEVERIDLQPSDLLSKVNHITA